MSEIIQHPSQNIQPFFLIDGKEVYKSTCLKAISSTEKLSKDRLRRVQGMSRYPGEVNTEISHEDALLFIGDPVLVSDPKEGPLLANIVTMKKNNKNYSEVDASSGLKDIQFTLRKIQGQEVKGRLYWKGTTTEDVFPCVGDNCLPIKPSVELNPPEGMTKFYFDLNLLRDMNVHLQLQNQSSTQNKVSPSGVIEKKCLVCKKAVKLTNMRCHVGAHILKDEVKGERDKICGFCSGTECETVLKVSKKSGQEYYSIQKSDCPYWIDYGRTKKFNKKKNPCTNRYIRCPIKKCLSYIWTYNYKYHHEKKHSGEEISSTMVISEAEMDYLIE